ncbi:MAG: lamin tail domain-containing protein, partial [Lentimicrobium sp.]|uniref:lamin tail domain-containing protein n=1 Tax=Lentimicrobium sp. TaxID=2034841 RepID=UPI0025D18D79
MSEVKGQAWLEVDEGAGHYDYIEKHDSTWIHWGTNWTTWGNAEVRVNTNGADVWYPSVYMHMNGSDRHLSTIQELSWHHFPAVNWVAGAALDYYLRLDGNDFANYQNELMIVDVEKQDVSGYLLNQPKQLVLQFSIDVGTNAGRELRRLWVRNDGTLQEGNGAGDIDYDQVRLYYETGAFFDFNGNEASENLWGDWGGDPTDNERWGNENLNGGAGIAIPSSGGNKLLCYVVIESFNASVVTGRNAHFKIETDGMSLDEFGVDHRFLVRIDEKRNANVLPLADCDPATDLIISEYVEGSSNNKAIEIANLTNSPINLGDYTILTYFNGSVTSSNPIPLNSIILQPNDVWVVVDYNAGAALATLADQVAPNFGMFNGNDAVVLFKNSTSSTIDIFGNIGCYPDNGLATNPDDGWTAGAAFQTVDRTLVRQPFVTTGINVDPLHTGNQSQTACPFPTLATEWIQFTTDIYSNLGYHEAEVPPSIIDQPDSQAICENQQVSFSVVAAGGIFPYNYQWWMNTGSGWLVVPNAPPYAGATGSTLTINPATISMDGYQFYCQVNNSPPSICFINSNTAFLTVNPIPVQPVTAASDRNNFCPDDAGEISLSVTGGSGNTLRWFSESCGGTLVGVGNPLIIPSPVVITTYFAWWENSCGNSSCVSTIVTV